MMIDFFIGFLLSFLVAYAAYKKESLSISGFITAVILSTLLYFFGGVIVWSSLIAFFISSSLLTKFKEKEKLKYTITNEKDGKRDFIQVLANGFIPLLFAFLFYIISNDIFQLVAIVSIASSNSDTWASELGTLSKGKTLSIITLKPIKKGQSGGVSLFGFFAGFLGSFFIALFYSLILFILKSSTIYELLINISLITVGGFIGCIIDSYLGATLQAKYKSPLLDDIIESSIYKNVKSELVSGFKIITNDVVNISSSVLSSISILIFILIFL